MHFLKRLFNRTSRPRILSSTYDVTEHIESFLHKLCNCGHTRNAKNEIVRAKLPVPFFILYLLYVAFSTCNFIYRFTVFYKTTWVITTWGTLMVELVPAIFVIVIAPASYKSNIAYIQEYFQNYDAIDTMLTIPTARRYNQEKRKYTRLFYLGIIGYGIKVVIFDLIPNVPDFKWRTLLFVDIFISILFTYINLLNIAIKLAILKNRFEMYGSQLSTALQTPWQENKDEFVDNLLEFKSGYQLFYKQQILLAKIYGWQILFGVVYIEIDLILIVYGGLKLIMMSPQDAWTLILSGSVKMFLYGGVLFVMATCFEDMMKARIQILSKLEDKSLDMEGNSVNHSEDKEVHRQVVTLRSQIRRQPFSFSICKMLKLDYSMIKSIFGFTVTYTFVLAQFNLKWNNVYEANEIFRSPEED